MTTATAEKPADLASLRRISDPRAKLRAAAALINSSEQQATSRALRRNAAAVLIFRASQAGDDPMQPAAMWRDTMNVSRSLWHKIVDESNPARIGERQAQLAEIQDEIRDLPTERAAELPRLVREEAKVAHKLQRHLDQVAAIEQLQAEIDADVTVASGLLQLAREESEVVHALELLIAAVMKLRDEVAVKLMNGSYGPPVANAEIARITGLSSARVAQLRGIR